ncbi:ABC transporter permease [Candidatus Nitronereus thalassa]|uniref:ABC transporter permease n=1 Tax=Candidatus Nitronereus thalassa TaxID=3020898 RepID=A0ABU3K5F5_9BACT|nr:ABC transporter permease [Candidatus Nitronereus thalassa]MDT7041608.1 ABC transporter permease [Candidatus Nitronereus thalassa]
MNISPFRPQSWLLFPTLLVLGVFFCLPLLLMFGVSLASRGLYGGIEWTMTFENYQRLADPLYWNIYGRSLVLAGATTLVCLVAGFPLAMVMARSSARMQTILLILVMIPFWTNFLVRTYAWMFLLRTEGLFNTVLLHLNIIDVPLDLLYTNGAVFIGLVYGYLPFMILPLYVAIERISPSFEEAAADLYASRWSVLRYVVMPLAKPGIVVGCILVFIPSLGAFITPHLLGGGQSMMLGTLIQHEFLVVRDWPFGSAISFLLMGLVLVVSVPVFQGQKLWGKP